MAFGYSVEPLEGLSGNLPTELSLESNYPNPFSPETTISFNLPEEIRVQIIVYDVQGRQVDILVDSTLPAGNHGVVFRADHLPSGTYLYRMVTPT